MRDGHLGLINVAKLGITVLLPDTAPVHSVRHREGPRTRELAKAEIDVMLAKAIIETTQTECAAPIVFVRKMDGILRFCIDCCKLNAVAI